MSSHICASCGSPFPRNDVLATLADGQRFAFDPARARVWRVCSACGQWNLLGAEASAGALPELQQRFATGLIQEFDGLALSGLAGTMQLIRLGATDTPAPTDPGALRDDVARQARRREVDRRTRGLMGFFWCMLGSWVLLTLYFLGEPLVEGGGRGAAHVAAALGMWLGMVAIANAVWGRLQVGAVSLFTPWRQPTRLAQLVNGGAVTYLLYGIADIAYRLYEGTFELHNIAVLAILLSVLSTVFHTRLTSLTSTWTPQALHRFGLTLNGAMFGVFALYFWSLPRWILLATMAIGFAFGMVGYARSRRPAFAVTLRSGRTIPIKQRALRGLAVYWVEEFQTFRVTGLPDGSCLDGDDAASAVSALLRWYHGVTHQLSDTTEQAWQLLRSVGDLRGLLAMLAGYRADQDGRIDLLNLPAVYRLALDFALADRQRVTTGIAPLRDASEAAIEVAEEAEELDRELRLPAPP